MIARVVLLLVGLMLAGCASKPPLTSIAGGESKVFEAPKYAVLGKTDYDQEWIDSQVEGGVAAFGWSRPLPRPPELDDPDRKKPSVAAPQKKARVAAPQIKKRGIIRRVRERVVLAKPMVPVPYLIPTAPPAREVAPPAPAPPPRDPVDILLSPAAD